MVKIAIYILPYDYINNSNYNKLSVNASVVAILLISCN